MKSFMLVYEFSTVLIQKNKVPEKRGMMSNAVRR
jgi:hypothetical protein